MPGVQAAAGHPRRSSRGARRPGAPLHDPTVTAYLLRPELFGGRHINVEIETKSELTMGMTVADYWRVTGRPANARYMREVDVEGFFGLLFERIARLP